MDLPVTKKIFVHNRDLGFFTQRAMTVQRFAQDGDGNLVLTWCNHAGAQPESVDNEIPRIDQPDICWTSTILVCDKCPAWRQEYEKYWEDAPFEGISYGY